ncbi:hypothetical protein DL767_000709 [Monosporascus sp. MG133]|nr:hypothetical protein DL767_000709 [Monosporascus sp. MG133]
MAELKPYRGGYYLSKYVPSYCRCLLALVFAVTLVALPWRIFTTRTKYSIAFAVGISFEVIGFAARAVAQDKTDKLMPFVIQNTFILLAPALFAASIYMVLGCVVCGVRGKAYSLVPIRWLTKLFVLGDVLSFCVQGSAAGLMATGNNAAIVEKIVVAGLFIQIIVFGFFITTTVVFHSRMNKHPTTAAQDPTSSWAKDLYMLCGVSVLIMVRSIFRVVEFIQGYDGYLLLNE